MRGMGKPSSLHPDNISDNISDSEGEGGVTPTLRRYSNNKRVQRMCEQRRTSLHLRDFNGVLRQVSLAVTFHAGVFSCL